MIAGTERRARAARLICTYGIVMAGVLLSLWLAGLHKDDVFYTGDGGLKALLVRQFAAGQRQITLALPASDWIRKLWTSGFYPFEAPLVHRFDDRYHALSPFYFPLVTVPFYRLLGHSGLLVIPLVSLWCVWLRFCYVCRRLDAPAFAANAGLATLVFASPLTLYGAVFWEHTLAVALAFYGFTALMLSPRAGSRIENAFTAGVALGLACVFREEIACAVAALGLLSLSPKRFPSTSMLALSSKRLLLVVGLALPLLAFLAINRLVYDDFLGVHGLAFVADQSTFQRALRGWTLLKTLLVLLVAFFPSMLFPFVGTIALRIADGKRGLCFERGWLAWTLLTLVLTLFVLSSPGGHQWGPRFYLVLVPVVCLVAVTLLASVRSRTRGLVRFSLMATFVVLGLIGGWRNTIGLIRALPQHYAPRLAMLAALRKHESRVIVVSHQSLPEELASLFGRKDFLLMRKGKHLRRIGPALLAAGQERFAYVCYRARPCPPFSSFPKELRRTWPDLEVVFTRNDSFGRYVVYDGFLRIPAESRPPGS